MNREGEAWGSCRFWSKTGEHSTWCGQVHSQITHHETGKCVERILKKISLRLNSASHNNTSWYTDTDRILEHPPSGGSLHCKGPTLRKTVLRFFWVPPCMCGGVQWEGEVSSLLPSSPHNPSALKGKASIMFSVPWLHWQAKSWFILHERGRQRGLEGGSVCLLHTFFCSTRSLSTAKSYGAWYLEGIHFVQRKLRVY